MEASNNHNSDINTGNIISPSQGNAFINATEIFSEINTLDQSSDEKKG
jgi:hypothetical protein